MKNQLQVQNVVSLPLVLSNSHTASIYAAWFVGTASSPLASCSCTTAAWRDVKTRSGDRYLRNSSPACGYSGEWTLF